MVDNLRGLVLTECVDFSCLGQMGGLVKLRLESCEGDDKMFENLIGLVGLEILELFNCWKVTSLGFIVGMKNLRRLYVNCRRVIWKDFGDIVENGNLRDLEEFEGFFWRGLDEVRFINHLKKLKKLAIIERDESGNRLKCIVWDNLNELEELVLVKQCVNYKIWTDWIRVNKLKSLILRDCNCIVADGDGVGGCWKHLIYFVSLEKLVLERCYWADDMLITEIANRLTKLRHLDLGYCVIWGIECLGNLRYLEYLDTGNGLVEDTALKIFDSELKRLKNLKCCVDDCWEIDNSLFEFVSVDRYSVPNMR